MMQVRITSEFMLTAVELWLPLDTSLEAITGMYFSPDAFVVEILRVKN